MAARFTPRAKGNPSSHSGHAGSGGEFAGAAVGAVEVEYGVTNAWQVGVEFGRSINKARSSLADESTLSGTGLSIQHVWMGSKTHFAIGIEGGLSGNLNAANSYEIEPYVTVARDVTSWLHLVGGVGSETSMPTERGKNNFGLESETEQTVNAAAIFALGQLRLTNEFTGIFFEGGHVTAWTPGIIYKPTEKFELGVARPIKIGDAGLPERFVLQLMIEL